jgi:hypothetical protein
MKNHQWNPTDEETSDELITDEDTSLEPIMDTKTAAE